MPKFFQKFDLGKSLLNGAALFQAYQFGRALHVYDPAGWNIREVNIAGLILGSIVNVIVALAATRLPGLAGKARIRSAWIGFVLLLLLSPSLVAPAMFILFQELPIGPGWILFLSIGLSAAPDLAIALGGFIAGKSLVHLASDDKPLLSKPQSDWSDSAKGRSAKKSGRSAGAAKPPTNIPCRYAGAGCELIGTQNAMNAHAPHCKFKPSVIDPTLLVGSNEIKTQTKVEKK